MKKRLLYWLTLFLCGGVLYVTIELLWRGWSHYSMFLAGGIGFLLLGRLTKDRLPPWVEVLIGAGIITMIELASGLVFNRNYTVWDYRDAPLNLWGQICLPFTLFWFALSGIAIFLEDGMRRLLFSQPFPQYRWVV